MKVTLKQTGGLMGRTKAAEAEWPDSTEAFETLLGLIKRKQKSATKDQYAYFLKSEETKGEVSISINEIPEQYAPFFDELYQKLKIVNH